MPAWQEGGCYGVKVVNIAPGNAARGLPGLHSTYVLYDARTGVPLAWIDGDEITARRTAATSALAASWLAPASASRLAVIGAGRIARLLPEAHRVARPIEHVTVWARAPARAAALADDLLAQGFDACVAASVEAAVGEADIVSCATLARAPLVCGRWLAPGSHLDLIGSFAPAMREADDDCFAGARVVVGQRRCGDQERRPDRTAGARRRPARGHRHARRARARPARRRSRARSVRWRPPARAERWRARARAAHRLQVGRQRARRPRRGDARARR